MASTVETLALAYYFTGKESYAEHAAKCLRVWRSFRSGDTDESVHLNYAQAVPGENTGRGTGILEGRNISDAADAAGLLAGSSSWTEQDRIEFKLWLETYLNWLLTSKNGRAEAGATNNHGTWYDVQAMQLALVLGKSDVAKQIAIKPPDRNASPSKSNRTDGSRWSWPGRRHLAIRTSILKRCSRWPLCQNMSALTCGAAGSPTARMRWRRRWIFCCVMRADPFKKMALLNKLREF